MSRIEAVAAAANEYGQRSVENMEMGRRLGRKIIEGYDKYLRPEGGLVVGVPPHGEWRHDAGDYRDATFSCYHVPILTVRDIEFGMCVTVLENLWVRQVVRLEKQGDRIAVFVDNGEAVWVPTEYSDGDIEGVCERLYQALLGLYRGDVNVFLHGDERQMTIGFGGSRVGKVGS